MPVGYTRLDKKGVLKNKLSLTKRNFDKRSANETVADENCNTNLTNDYENVHASNLRENIPPKSLYDQPNNFESQSTKRPFEEIVDNTSDGVKRPKFTSERTLAERDRGQQRSAMLNGYHTEGHGTNSYGGRKANHDARPPIATLSNLGNTCFLNSVLYTLRFTPNFLHNLHHLVADLALADQKLSQVKAKSSSLGRNFANLANTGSRSWSSKDLLSLGGVNESNNGPKSKIQVTTEKLHEMYASLRAAEARDSSEPYQAEPFLAALRNVNPIFEGNQQQDAHELLMCLLDSVRETCRSLRARFTHHLQLPNGIIPLNDQTSVDSETAATLTCSKSSLGIIRKSWKNRKKAKTFKPDSPTKESNGKPPPVVEEDCVTSNNEWTKDLGFDFVAEDFEGTTVLRTTCLECEIVTERKQTMCDISVPIPEDRRSENDALGDPSTVYQHACVTSECLRDQNKYWCDRCARYNEARRSVTYETLPRLLVLQLKRFSGGMEKLTAYMPTPLTLACFCDTCCLMPIEDRPHQYTLYGVIMHLGQTLTGGHYIAYTRANYADYSSAYLCCQRDSKSCLVPNANDKPNFMKNLFARNKNNGISATDKVQPIKRKVPLPLAPPGTAVPIQPTEADFCSSLDCCGIRLSRGIWSNDEQSSPDRDVWLMCDDETVKPISFEELDELLSSKPKIRSASTPYLLFYVKTEVD